MKQLTAALFLCVFIPTRNLAQDPPRPALSPAAVIAAPEDAQPGDLVTLDASQSNGVSFAWFCDYEASHYRAVNGGKLCVFATSEPGRYVFVLAVAAGDEVSITSHIVMVGDTPRPPEPTPNPPGPDPPTPDLEGLAKLAHGWAAILPAAAKAKAGAVAGSFRSVAAAIAAGTLSKPTDILAATKENNQQATGDQQAAWVPWAEKLQAELATRYADGTLRVAEDYREAWLEIAAGLEAVR